jgi:hypothetical protein
VQIRFRDIDGLDAEGITALDPVNPNSVLIIEESSQSVREYDLSTHGVVIQVMEWDLDTYLPLQGTRGPEGITFVPNDELIDLGFVNDAGLPVMGVAGMGGLVFVAHQNGGQIYAFDLGTTGSVVLLGTYDTERVESSGLDFDMSTGRLYIWHGGLGLNDMEVARLSSTEAVYPAVNRKLITDYMWDYPYPGNLEGVTVTSVHSCSPEGRSLYLTLDDGGPYSIHLYADWPCF